MHRNKYALTRSAMRWWIGRTRRSAVFSPRKARSTPREGLVAAHAVGRRQIRLRQRSADHVDAIEGGRVVDAGVVAAVVEAVLADLAHEMPPSASGEAAWDIGVLRTDCRWEILPARADRPDPSRPPTGHCNSMRNRPNGQCCWTSAPAALGS